MFPVQALSLLIEEGKKIRKIDWDVDYYLYYDKDSFVVKDCNNLVANFSFDYYSNMWEEYIPKSLCWEEYNFCIGDKIFLDQELTVVHISKDYILTETSQSTPIIIEKFGLEKGWFEINKV